MKPSIGSFEVTVGTCTPQKVFQTYYYATVILKEKQIAKLPMWHAAMALKIEIFNARAHWLFLLYFNPTVCLRDKELNK